MFFPVTRQRLPIVACAKASHLSLAGLRFTASVGRFPDGRIGELFLNNHKSGNQSDTNARDAAIILSFAIQYGADINEIRKALCRDNAGHALGPVGEALDRLEAEGALP